MSREQVASNYTHRATVMRYPDRTWFWVCECGTGNAGGYYEHLWPMSAAARHVTKHRRFP